MAPEAVAFCGVEANELTMQHDTSASKTLQSYPFDSMFDYADKERFALSCTKNEEDVKDPVRSKLHASLVCLILFLRPCDGLATHLFLNLTVKTLYGSKSGFWSCLSIPEDRSILRFFITL